MAQQRHRWALGALVEDIFGTFPPSPQEKKRHTKGLWNWYRLNYLLMSAETAQKLACAMGPWQKHSFQLLKDWWTAAYQDPGYSLFDILDIVSDSDQLPALNTFEDTSRTEEAWDNLLKHLQLRRWPRGEIKQPSKIWDTRNPSRSYNERLRFLFMCEFFFEGNYRPELEDESNFGTREWARRTSAQYAYCQAVSWEAFYCDGRRADTLLDSGNAKPSTYHKHPVNRAIEAVEILNNEDPIARILAHGPMTEPCPWLDPEGDKSNNLPYYLWDVQAKKTVETSALDYYPQYTAISHTWGRWVKGEPKEVSGVPWKVPQNDRFEVDDIAKHLAMTPTRTPFVWLDLVCIPQDGSIIGAREIARQAAIFRGASHVIAWLNEMDDFDGLEAILRWQVLHFLELRDTDQQSEIQRQIDHTWLSFAGKPSNLLVPRNGALNGTNIVVNPWFTSLWTLQEVSLRPDLWLCTRNWKPLSLGLQQPLSFIGFITIFETFYHHNEPALKVPFSPELAKQSHIALFEMMHWRFSTGLHRIMNLNQISLLTLGDRRECTGRRAEAIMSALGVTDWYNEKLETIKPEETNFLHAIVDQDLVLQKYPLGFVRELCTKIPSDFFGSVLKLDMSSLDKSLMLVPKRGSLLPFNDVSTFYMDGNVFRSVGVASSAHRSVSTWKPLLNGQVSIPQACVISSQSIVDGMQNPAILPTRLMSKDKSEYPLPPGYWDKDIWGYDKSEAERLCHLHRWVAQQTRETYAVVVECSRTQSPRMINVAGLILQRLDSGYLAKTDNFTALDPECTIDLEKVDVVNWVVD
ncbi:hypothetical protein F4680DRAFT_31994 [Xylaria scruposa]|nr:hypothetical protein F4680DRAFT_31994 [Xylaria scruposa]